MVSFAEHSSLPIFAGLFVLLVLLLTTTGCSTLRNAKPWHRIELQQEFNAALIKQNGASTYTWSDYLQQEEKLFQELKTQLSETDTYQGYRYEHPAFRIIDGNLARLGSGNPFGGRGITPATGR